MKQIVLVLEAVGAGARTSIEVAAVCGLSVKTASAVLSELASDGLIEKVGEQRRQGRGWPWQYHYRVPLRVLLRQHR